MRVLDEVADAIQRARNQVPQLALTSVKLEDQFEGMAMMASRWKQLERRLVCTLPPLDFDQGHWWLPDDFSTIWDLCHCVSIHHPDWALPAERSLRAWRNAQIFAVVRRELADVCNVDPRKVVRSARLIHDLDMGC
jgi:hypothetical protein